MEKILLTSERLDKRNLSYLKSYDFSKNKNTQEQYAVDLRKKIRKTFFSKNRLLNCKISISEISPDFTQALNCKYNSCVSYQEKLSFLFQMIIDPNYHLPYKNYFFSLVSRCLKKKEEIQFFIRSSYLKVLIAYLNTENSLLLPQTTLIIANISSADRISCDILLDNDILRILLLLIENNIGVVQDNCLWAIKNLCLDLSRAQTTLINCGFFEKITCIIKNIDNSKPKYYEILYCMIKKLKDLQKIDQALELISQALSDRNRESDIIRVCLWGISYIKNKSLLIERLINFKFMKENLIYYINSEDVNIVFPAINAVEIIVDISGNHIQELINIGLLNALHKQINSKKKSIREDAFFILSSIVAQDQTKIREIFKHQNLVENTFNGIIDSCAKVRSEAWHFFYMISNPNCKDFIYAILQMNFFNIVLESLSMESENVIIKLALTFLENCLLAEALTGLKYILQLFMDLRIFEYISNFKDSENDEVAETALRILDTFYDFQSDFY
ncbi:hypothetical protein SteCoe_27372 [Stentor coeruleus]|uniref:Importin subunit alpha n=1 Tax=Stentor coeruleus TaxID=5963 RepID=A0A1R2BAS6_9CILI|nr:hypothetical protein SteCoe_27372 [Stentor coeruleus]